MTKEKENIVRGSSFLIKVKYKENNSIQGTIHWLEKRKVVNFRSMMELVMLLNESLDEKELRSWQGENGTVEIAK